MACRSLAPHAQRHRGVVQKELTVNGSTLAVSVLEEYEVGRGGGRWRQVLGSRRCLRAPRWRH